MQRLQTAARCISSFAAVADIGYTNIEMAKARRSHGLGSAASISPAAARRAPDSFVVGRRSGAGVLMTSTAAVSATPVQAPSPVTDKLFGEAHRHLKNHADEWSPRQQEQIARLFK